MKTIEKELYRGPIAGMVHHAFRLRPDRLGVYELMLEREPNNLHDPNAIAVRAFDDRAVTRKVGYIPRNRTRPIHEAADRGLNTRVKVVDYVSLDGTPVLWPVISVTVRERAPKPAVALRPAGTRRLLLPTRDSVV